MPSIVAFELVERAAGLDEDYARTYERTYKVRTDTPAADAKWVVDHIAPALGATYDTGTETDAAAVIKGLSVRADPSDGYGLTWIATVPYGPWDPYRHASSPLLLKPLVTLEGVNYQRPAERDVTGVPVANTAGDPYDPTPEMDDARCVIRVQKNLATFSPSAVLFYANKINSDTFFGMQPHTCKFDPPKGTVAYHQACGNYWQVEYQIVVNPNVQVDYATGAEVVVGWDKMVPSRGYRQLVAGAYHKIYNADGSDIDQAAFLGPSGAALAPPISAGDVVFTRWQVYRELDFTSTLGLDPTMFF